MNIFSREKYRARTINTRPGYNIQGASYQEFTPTHEQESKTDESSTLLTSQKESKTTYSTTESHQKTTLESEIKPLITDSPSVSTEKANILEGTTKDESSHTTDLTHKPTKVIPTKSRSDKHEEALATGLTREESTEPIVKASTGTYGDKDASNNGVGSTAVYVSMRMTTEPVVQEKTTKTLLPPDRGEPPEPPLFLEGTEAAEESTTESHLSAEGTETKDKITKVLAEGTETIDKVTTGTNLSPEGVKTVDKITTESYLSSVGLETKDKITTVSAEGVETIDKITTEGTKNIGKVTREGEKTIDKITTEAAEGTETIDKITTKSAEGTETIDKITTGSNLSPEGVKTIDEKTTESHLSPEGREPEEWRMTTERTEPSTEVTSEESTTSSDRTSKEFYIPLPAESSTVHESISVKVYTSLYPTMETRKHTQKGRPDTEVPTTESEDDKLTKSSTKFIRQVLTGDRTTTLQTTTRLMRTNRTVSSTNFQPFNPIQPWLPVVVVAVVHLETSWQWAVSQGSIQVWGYDVGLLVDSCYSIGFDGYNSVYHSHYYTDKE